MPFNCLNTEADSSECVSSCWDLVRHNASLYKQLNLKTGAISKLIRSSD